MKRITELRRVLYGVGIMESKDMKAKRDPCRALQENLEKHKEQIELQDERDNPVGVSFTPVTSYPSLGVASQQKEYILNRVPMFGWKITLTQPIAWIFIG